MGGINMDVVLYWLIFMVFAIYFLIRNRWVYEEGRTLIYSDIELFKKLEAKYSYESMLWKYFWVWDFNWFLERSKDE